MRNIHLLNTCTCITKKEKLVILLERTNIAIYYVDTKSI